MLHDISDDNAADAHPDVPATGESLTRQQAIKQIERKRRFWLGAAWAQSG